MLLHRCAAHLAGRVAEILVLGEASGGAGGTEDRDLHQATILMMQRELSFGLVSLGHLSIGALSPTTTLLSLPGGVHQEMQRDLNRALTLALQVLGQHRPVLEGLARDLETRGFLVEANLAVALAPVM